MTKSLKTTSIMNCPGCGYSAVETMPVDACINLYECKSCQKLITPESGDCCVFCSYGTTPCPTSQLEQSSYSIVYEYSPKPAANQV